MFILGMGIACFITGFILYLLSSLVPILRYIFLDWIALFVMFLPFVIVLFRINSSRCWKQADRLPKWKHLMKYLRRDNEVVEIVGERAYPGESFVDVPLIGLFEYLGKDCYYNSGDKKYAWALENMNYTPDPRYGNFTHVLWWLGFSNSDEVKAVLRGELPDLRQKVYENMDRWDGSHGAKKLTKELKGYEGKVVDFKPSIIDRHSRAVNLIDKLPGKNKGS